MGAEVFIIYVKGVDVQVAFRSAVEQTEYDHGHADDTGTIAEKDECVVIDGAPLSEDEAEVLARTLIEARDSRIDNLAGPTGVLALLGGCRTPTGRSVPARADGCPDERTATPPPFEGRPGRGRGPRACPYRPVPPRCDGGIDVDERSTATITTVGSPEVTGRLFLGWANA
jgi:hypothetical protein